MRRKGVEEGEAVLLKPLLRLHLLLLLLLRRAFPLEAGGEGGQEGGEAEAREEGRVLREGPEDGEGQGGEARHAALWLGRLLWGGWGRGREQPREEVGAHRGQEAGAGCK